MNGVSSPELIRCASLLTIVYKEATLLRGTAQRLFHAGELDARWVVQLDTDFALADRVEAFGSRYGRLQDTLGDKLLPSFLRLMAERPGTALDNLNRAEKLGIVDSVSDWLVARNIRNRLVHEYVTDAAEFAAALNEAHRHVPMLIATYNAFNRHMRAALGEGIELPPVIID